MYGATEAKNWKSEFKAILKFEETAESLQGLEAATLKTKKLN